MRILKIFLTILIHKTIEIPIVPINIFKIGITGTLTCRFSNVGFAEVLISEKPKLLYEHQPISKVFAKYRKPFTIQGMVKTFRQPLLYLKIIHNCGKYASRRKKVFVKGINPNFIVKYYEKIRFIHLGFVELSNLPETKFR